MIYTRLARVPEQSFFLLGMRGVGKSTWARQVLPDAQRLDLLDEALFTDLLADPSLFRQLLSEVGPGEWVVVDEVQRIPSLLNEVHRMIEERGVRFALLGSSARKLKTAGTNLLAGRALRKAMHPLTRPNSVTTSTSKTRSAMAPSRWCGPPRTGGRSSRATRSCTCARRSGPRPRCATCRASCASCRWPR